MRDKINALHGKGTFKRSAIRLAGGAEALEAMLAGKGYRNVLEIGTFRGCSAALISQHCERVHTIDLRHGQLEQIGQPFDRRAFWESLGATNIDLHLIDTDYDKEALIASLEFDLAFIDGAHDADSVRRDFDLVRRCGRVLFHDYADNGRPEKDHVFHFVNSLSHGRVEVIGLFALWRAA